MAQLGARVTGSHEVTGSIPVSSTKILVENSRFPALSSGHCGEAVLFLGEEVLGGCSAAAVLELSHHRFVDLNLAILS